MISCMPQSGLTYTDLRWYGPILVLYRIWVTVRQAMHDAKTQAAVKSQPRQAELVRAAYRNPSRITAVR